MGEDHVFRIITKTLSVPTSPLSICAIAAKLADDIVGSNRSVAFALSRIANSAQLIVERALDHLEELLAGTQEAKK